MSINLTVRTHGNAGTTTTPPVDGDSSNGFNQGEIDRILAAMPNDDDTVVITGLNNGQPMTKTQVRALLTTNPETTAAPAPVAADDLPPVTPRESGSWDVSAFFRYAIGIGAESGPGGGVSLMHQWNIHPNFRLRFGGQLLGQSVSRDYALPGSPENDANSTFNAIGAGPVIGARIPVADRGRFFLDSELALRVMGTWTPSSTMGTLAGGGGQVCYDAGGGRQQCEERAGSSGNLGTTGGFDPRVGNSRSQSGVALDTALILGLGYLFPINEYGLVVNGGVDLGNFSTFTEGGSQSRWYVAPRIGAGFVW